MSEYMFGLTNKSITKKEGKMRDIFIIQNKK